jgi:23S rRNA G2445 N2-methylase RlmL
MEGKMEEKKRLSVVIDHWIEHNESHMAEYRKWAEKAGQLGLESMEAHIQKAIENLNQCNLSLKEALKSL